MSEEVKFIFNLDDQFTRKAKTAEASVSSLDDKMSKLKNLAATVGGALALGKVKDFLWSSVESFGRLEQFQTSLTTMFKGNRREAELLTSQLQKFAQATPFELSEIQEATKMMIAYGSTSGGVVKEMTMLGDISSGVGAPLKDIAYLYGTLRTQGRAFSKDIYQFTGRGIPIVEALAKTLGVAKNEVMNLVEKGKVGFPEVERAMKSMTEAGGQFSGMMKEQSKTLNGQISNLADAWDQLKTSIGESQSGIVKSTVAWATELINSINQTQQATNNLQKTWQKAGVHERSIMGIKDTDSKKFSQYRAGNEALTSLMMAASQKGIGAEAALAQRQLEISKMMAANLKQRESGQISDEEFLKKHAIFKGAKELGETLLAQTRATKAKQKEDMEMAKQNKTKEAGKVKSQQYTQITINIDEMIGVNTLNSKTEKSIGEDIGEAILRNMTEAVEDSQIVAGI